MKFQDWMTSHTSRYRTYLHGPWHENLISKNVRCSGWSCRSV